MPHCLRTFGYCHFHAEVSLTYHCRELDDAVAAEDGVVWVGNVYHVEGYKLCSLGVAFAKGYIQLYFSRASIFLPPKPISEY